MTSQNRTPSGLASGRLTTHYSDREVSTLAASLGRAARLYPLKVAVIESDVTLTFGELRYRTTLFAEHLVKLGVRAGDVVTAQLPNWWETQVVAQATSLIGAVFNPVVSIYRRSELEFIIGQARSKVFVVPGEYRGHNFRGMAEQIAEVLGGGLHVLVLRDPLTTPLPGMAPSLPEEEVSEDLWQKADHHDPDRIAYLLYTSGSTARPKGALHSSRTLMHEARQVADIGRLSDDDRVFMPSPVTHVTGLAFGVLLPADLGIGVLMQDRWDPSVAVDLVEQYRGTFCVSATTFLLGLTKEYESRGTTSTLETFICGGAEIGPELVQRAREAMGTKVVRCYGSTELPTFSVGDPFADLSHEALFDGRPVRGADYWVETAQGLTKVGVGELLIKGDELFLGYLDATLNEGAFHGDFFRTGDLVRVDEDGACAVVGRLKDIIIRGGENISAIEIEDQLQLHPLIDEVAVVAMPDELLGERACAYVVVKSGASLTIEDLRDHLKARGLAVQKTPEHLEIVETLPRTASGKVQKYRLRQLISETMGSHAAASPPAGRQGSGA